MSVGQSTPELDSFRGFSLPWESVKVPEVPLQLPNGALAGRAALGFQGQKGSSEISDFSILTGDSESRETSLGSLQTTVLGVASYPIDSSFGSEDEKLPRLRTTRTVSFGSSSPAPTLVPEPCSSAFSKCGALTKKAASKVFKMRQEVDEKESNLKSEFRTLGKFLSLKIEAISNVMGKVSQEKSRQLQDCSERYQRLIVEVTRNSKTLDADSELLLPLLYQQMYLICDEIIAIRDRVEQPGAPLKLRGL
jgi:hypothetical protein